MTGWRLHSFAAWFGARQFGVALISALVALPLLPRGLQPADANGDTRSVRIKNTHNSESIDMVFKRDGRYDQEALKKFNWFLRDWRTNEPTEMDPRLLDLVWEVYRDLGGSEPMHLVSGFRSPKTNNFLRSRSSGVAKESQHTRGKAMDFFVPGVPLARIRERGMMRQRGGVGFYPSSGSPFVHLDVGNVRAWPRMTRDQLVRLFPDGNTLHLPADGRPLAGYETTLARLGRDGKRGETVLAYATGDDPPRDTTKGKPATNVLASLFGSDEDEGEETKRKVVEPKRAVAARATPTTLGVSATTKPAVPALLPQARPVEIASLEPQTPVRASSTPTPLPLARPQAEAVLPSTRLTPLPAELPQPAPFREPVSAGLVTLPSATPHPEAQIVEAKPVLTALDFRKIAVQPMPTSHIALHVELLAPNRNWLAQAFSPPVAVTQFGRRSPNTIQAFAGPAVRAKRADTI